MDRKEKHFILSQSCPLWFVLDQKSRGDLIDGKCIYREHDNTPILDYTQPHPFFSEAA